MSLRHQLRGTSVRVFEMIPPIVASELGAAHGEAANRREKREAVFPFMNR
jgi:short-subunit dehydrogenase involved in D-alanine esterification of teichoic acids